MKKSFIFLLILAALISCTRKTMIEIQDVDNIIHPGKIAESESVTNIISLNRYNISESVDVRVWLFYNNNKVYIERWKCAMESPKLKRMWHFINDCENACLKHA